MFLSKFKIKENVMDKKDIIKEILECADELDQLKTAESKIYSNIITASAQSIAFGDDLYDRAPESFEEGQTGYCRNCGEDWPIVWQKFSDGTDIPNYRVELSPCCEDKLVDEYGDVVQDNSYQDIPYEQQIQQPEDEHLESQYEDRYGDGFEQYENRSDIGE